MSSFTYTTRQKSFVRFMLLLGVAGAAFLAGSPWQEPTSPRDVSAVFAPPAEAAESNSREPLPAIRAVEPAGTDTADRSGGGFDSQPRECDRSSGLSTECVWLD